MQLVEQNLKIYWFKKSIQVSEPQFSFWIQNRKTLLLRFMIKKKTKWDKTMGSNESVAMNCSTQKPMLNKL